jgi:hypothetical protein
MVPHNAQVGFAVAHPHLAAAVCHHSYRPVFRLQVRQAWFNGIDRILVERQVPAELALFLNGENIIQVLALSHRPIAHPPDEKALSQSADCSRR